jgi:hypothetical protein
MRCSRPGCMAILPDWLTRYSTSTCIGTSITTARWAGMLDSAVRIGY